MDDFLKLFDWIPFIATGGPVMVPLFLGSVLALGITLERIVALRPGAVAGREFLVEMETLAKKRDIEAGALLCRKSAGPLGSLMLEGLQYISLPRQDLLAVLETRGRSQARRFTRFLPTLALIGNISPMLGLLGTVTGMIRVFSAIQSSGVGDPKALAGGIGEALVTTVAGLSIAIPTAVAHRYLSDRASRLVADLEAATLELIGRFRGDISEV